MARQKVDIITCDRCGRTLTEEDVRTVEFSILYHAQVLDEVITTTPPIIHAASAPAPTRYVEVCKRCDTLLRKVSAQAAPPSKPGRKKEKEDVS